MNPLLSMAIAVTAVTFTVVYLLWSKVMALKQRKRPIRFVIFQEEGGDEWYWSERHGNNRRCGSDHGFDSQSIALAAVRDRVEMLKPEIKWEIIVNGMVSSSN